MSNRRLTRPRAQGASIPAPVKGWNAVDALDAMPADMAETLDNWFPETTYLRLRRGDESFCDTGTGARVGSLMEYNGGADSALLAASDDAVFNVSSGTASSLATGFTSDLWESTNFATGGGTYLIAVNGEDTPRVFNGATFVAAVNTIGGAPSAKKFHQVEAYQERIFYAEKDTLSVWYLTTGAYQGALTEFDFGPLCRLGGSIASITTWTRDNASAGANEMFCMVTTQGEVLIYTGSDPGGTPAWSLAARYEIGVPVSGRLPVTRIGGDCILVCQDGVMPLAKYLQMGRSYAQEIALSKNIGNAITNAVRTYKDEVGWQALLYPRANMLIVNVPQGSSTYYQYVLNTISGAWCRMIGQNGVSWALYNDDLYYGDSSGVVYKADTGTSDHGSAINGEIRTSYQFLGSKALVKRFTMARPMFQTTGNLILAMGVDVDFVNTSITDPLTSTVTTALWDTAIWDDAVWGGAYQLQNKWVSVNAIGHASAVHFKVSTATISVNLTSISLLYEAGGYL